MNYLDTNYIIRYLTSDVPELAKTAKKILESGKELYIPSIVLAETVYILENDYNISKQEICPPLLTILKQDNISSQSFCLQALEMYINENIEFYDCLFISDAILNKSSIHTFDKKMMKVFKNYS
jgi:predicted nucleic-acid-binding protein